MLVKKVPLFRKYTGLIGAAKGATLGCYTLQGPKFDVFSEVWTYLEAGSPYLKADIVLLDHLDHFLNRSLEETAQESKIAQRAKTLAG